MRLDVEALRRRLTETVASIGVVDTWNRVVCPVLVAIGERHARTGMLIEVEHALSAAVSLALASVPRPAGHLPAKALLACADEEQHSLPIEALDAALAERGLASRALGARVPPAALLAAVRRTGPTVVVLWSQHRQTADPAQVKAVLRSPARPMVMAACGPGWDPAALPDGATRPESLRATVDLLAACLLGTNPASVNQPIGRS